MQTDTRHDGSIRFLRAAGRRESSRRSGVLPRKNLSSERGTQMEDSTSDTLARMVVPQSAPLKLQIKRFSCERGLWGATELEESLFLTP